MCAALTIQSNPVANVLWNSSVSDSQVYMHPSVLPVKYKSPSFKTYLKKKVEEQIKICPRVLDKENIENMGHLIHFNKGYDLLMIEANLLVMRAMINSVKLDELGKKMQEKVTILIDEDFPSVCDGNSAELGDDFTSLTVENFADLKCVVSRWKTQHKLAPTKILTKGDWKRRHKTLISIVFAIQKAESFKQIEKTI
jgi:hypothetical protein